MDMPDDIRETARLTWRLNPVECKQYIAAALMEEREQCAKIAESRTVGWDGGVGFEDDGGLDERGYVLAAESIAAAIRRGATK
jgi:hypothetical protein